MYMQIKVHDGLYPLCEKVVQDTEHAEFFPVCDIPSDKLTDEQLTIVHYRIESFSICSNI